MDERLSGQYWATTLTHLRAIRAGKVAAHPDVWAARGAVRSAGDIAVIPVMGTITQRGGWFGTSIDGTRAAFRAAQADGSRAIVMLYDTPGGEVYGVDEFATEMRDRRGKGGKPVVAAVDPLAASAGYYLAAQADEILVTPSGEIGSIGVYGGHEDWSRALDQMGVTVTLVSAGEGKTAGNMFEPLSDEARTDMEAAINRYYGMFTSAVAKGRTVSVDKVRSEWKAKVYGAKDAVEIGMADGIGTVDDAIRRASAIANRRAAPASVEREVEHRMRSRSRIV